MFEKNAAMEILMRFLDRKVKEAEEEVTQNGVLSEDKAIPLMLKMQFNHIAHLEESVNERFGQINQRFEQVDQRFEQVDQRFEQVDQRFEQVEQRFAQVERRFDQIDRRFEEVNERFGRIDQSFDHIQRDMGSRFRHVERMFLGGFAFLSFLITILRFVK